MELLWRLLRDESGQDVVEYALVLALIALAAFGLIMAVGGGVNTIWNAANTAVSTAAQQINVGQ
jgi:pilus assembly protein Flp/PilA